MPLEKSMTARIPAFLLQSHKQNHICIWIASSAMTTLFIITAYDMALFSFEIESLL